MTITYDKSLDLLKVHLSDYLPYLERAIATIKTLETTDPNSEEFSQALADLHVAVTVLEPYSEGMVEAINQFTDDRPD
jgi:hypothetical protein